MSVSVTPDGATQLDAIMSAVSPAYRIGKAGITIDGGHALDFARYPYVIDMIDRTPRHVTVLKGAQMGFTVAFILKALEAARTQDLRGIGYFFPTEGEVSDFVKARFNPMMDSNPLWGDVVINDANSTTLKRFGDTFLYFRGAGQIGTGAGSKSKSKQKSIPLDWIIKDESDEMDFDRKATLAYRLDAAGDNAYDAELSTPTLPNYGVDARYRESNQSVWMLQCDKCNGWTCRELSYPDCIALPTPDSDAYYLCMECREEHVVRKAEWVAREQSITDHVGYWVSQLCSPTKTAHQIVLASRKHAEDGTVGEFENQTLARGYADVDEEITESQLEQLVDSDLPRPLDHVGPAAMGVDPGKPHWYEVRIRINERDSIQIARGRADTYEELHAIALRYNVESGVMDQGADATSVEKFVHDHRGWYGCFYTNTKNQREPQWDHRRNIVTVNRTYLLDAARNDILNGSITFYRTDKFWREQFVPQMINLKRATITLNDRTNETKVEWVVTGRTKNDHLRHANAYAHLAATRVALAKATRSAQAQAKTRRRNKPRGFMTA